jgi:hypothetical protein
MKTLLVELFSPKIFIHKNTTDRNVCSTNFHSEKILTKIFKFHNFFNSIFSFILLASKIFIYFFPNLKFLVFNSKFPTFYQPESSPFFQLFRIQIKRGTKSPDIREVKFKNGCYVSLPFANPM